MADGSMKVVYAALAGNVLVALSKYGAAAVSGSSAMLTEAVHSTADGLNQVLLVVGNRRSAARPDREPAFGYGAEIYFWTIVVAVMIFLVGGAVSFYEGWRELSHPEPIRSPVVSLVVLGLALLFEGASFAVGLREYKTVARKHDDGTEVGFWRFIELSKDPNLYESLLEDSAALVGIAIAAVGVVGNAYLGVLWADGAASIGIGLLLVATSVVIARATQSLIAGESVAPALLADLKKVLVCDGRIEGYTGMKTLHLGPKQILIALEVRLVPDTSAAEARAEFQRVGAALRAVDERVRHVYFQLA